MTEASDTWGTRLIAAGAVVVIVVGAFAASGRNSGTEKHGHAIVSTAPPTATPAPSSPSSTTPAPPTHRPTHPPTLPPGVSVTLTPSAEPTATSATSSPSASAPVAASPTSSSASTTSVPPGVLGTFSYTTTGSEQTNIPGTARTFPKTTTITNSLQGCGVLSTWKPIAEHVQSQLLCPDGKALKVKAYKTTISFFGVSSGESFTCTGDSYIYQPGAKAGQVWSYRCTAPDAVAKQAAHVVGYSTMTVGGTTLRVLHVRVETTLTGTDAGKSTQEYWIATNKPVLVKESGSVDATQQGIHYQSSFSLTLNSLTPKS